MRRLATLFLALATLGLSASYSLDAHATPPLAAISTMSAAQDTPPMGQGAGLGLCVVYGAVVAVAVSILKRFPFGIGKWIGTHPKVCAAVLSAVAALAPLLKGSGMTISELALCVAAYFSGSQGMYQGVMDPAADALGIEAPRWA